MKRVSAAVSRAAACAAVAVVVCGATTVSAEEPAFPAVAAPEGREPTRYGELFAPHEPLYAVVGWRGNANAKFQISFRYRFLGGREGGGRTSWVEDINFGFTQTSLWDIELESSPFRDTSYRPSLFYREETVRRWSRPGRRVGLEAGVEHESNGQAGERSRSLNIVFVRPIFHLGDERGWHWTVAPKLFAYFGSLSDNPDIADFRGYAEVVVARGHPDGLELRATLRKGTRSDRGSAQLDATWPLDRLRGGRIAAYLHLQVFAGWGESLIEYDVKGPTQVRLGITVLR